MTEWPLCWQAICSVCCLFRALCMRLHFLGSHVSKWLCRHHLLIWSLLVSEIGSASTPVLHRLSCPRPGWCHHWQVDVWPGLLHFSQASGCRDMGLNQTSPMLPHPISWSQYWTCLLPKLDVYEEARFLAKEQVVQSKACQVSWSVVVWL